MTGFTSPAHLLEVDDFDAVTLKAVLSAAQEWKTNPLAVPRCLEGKGAALLFEKPSTRTRVSTEMAIVTLGGHPVSLRGEEVGLGVRESARDIAKMLSGYCSLIGARVKDHRELEAMASVASVPVINLLSDRAHPCQAVADLLTLREHFGQLDGRRMAFVGDGNNVVASLAYAAALSGLEIVVSSPSGYELDSDVVARAHNLGGTIELISDPYEAVAGADAIYTDVWTSMGQEDQSDIRRAAFAGYQINEALMATAGPKAVFLHCLPAHRGEEVAAEVIDGAQSLVWQQAENRMHATRAVIVQLLGESSEGI